MVKTERRFEEHIADYDKHDKKSQFANNVVKIFIYTFGWTFFK